MKISSSVSSIPIATLALLGVVLAYLQIYQHSFLWFEELTLEDRLNENLQVVLLVICGALTLLRWRNATGLMFTCFFLVVALEEISWGHRLFGFSLPWLESINFQQETNLHNLLPLKSSKLPYFGVAVGLVLASFFLRFKMALRTDISLAAALATVAWSVVDTRTHPYFFEVTETWIYFVWLRMVIGIQGQR